MNSRRRKLSQQWWAGRPALQAVGTIFSDNNFAAGAKYAVTGAGITFSGGQINMTGGTASFNDYITLVDPTNPWINTSLEKWTISVQCITPTVIDANSFGIGVGVRSSNAFVTMNALFRWGWDTGAPAAIFMYPGNAITNQLTSGTFTSPGVSTTVWFDVTRNKNVYTVTTYQSDHSTVLKTATFTMSLATGAVNQANNTGKFVIENFGGTNLKILQWNITTPARKFVDYVFLGDSNMYGMFAGSNAVRFAEAAATAKGKSFEVLAGIADRTAEVVLRLNEAIALKPRFAFLSIGRNDIANGVVTGTWQTNINTVISTLQNAGIIVKLGGVIASNVDVSAVQAFYTGKVNAQVNSYVATKGAGTALNITHDSGDGIHMNATGNGVESTLIQPIL